VNSISSIAVMSGIKTLFVFKGNLSREKNMVAHTHSTLLTLLTLLTERFVVTKIRFLKNCSVKNLICL
jgi:hypothetical protein